MSVLNRHGSLDQVQGIGMPLSCLIGFRLGQLVGWRAGLPLAITLVVALQLGDTEFNPIYEMLILGPWAAGQLIRTRSSLLDEVARRSADLRREQELLATESVRLDRTRIARELHDVLAHHISVIVIQANATLRLATEQPNRAKAMLATVTSLCRQAESEMHQVTSLLSPEPSALSVELTAVAERARDTGTRVECVWSDGIDSTSGPVSQSALRVVQEAVTNAMKHAAGADISISLRLLAGSLTVLVENGRGTDAGATLAGLDGGLGLRGLHNRVQDSGGTFSAGPGGRGWLLRAEFPLPDGADPGLVLLAADPAGKARS